MSQHPLNPEQHRAVHHDGGPLLLLAGAGSGKTRVITHRIARLLSEGALPSSILALTFTNKAAAEMKERAVALAGQAAEHTFISTFHSACARLLRRDAHRVGLTPSFSIYDTDDQTALLRGVCESLGMPNDAAALRETRARIDDAKNHALRVHDVHTKATDTDGEAFAELFEAYQGALRQANACDFGDLVVHVVHALQDDAGYRDKLRFRFQHLLVDEFQDTNVAQYELIRLLSPESGDVVVVGDDDQAIYGWRGATVENVRRFRDEQPNCSVIALEQNYRSGPNILDASHAIVEKLPERMEKRLRTDRTDRSPVRVFIGRDDREEADFVVREIQSLRAREGLQNHDFAVFFRTNAQSRVIEERFRSAGIRHVLRGTVAWFDRKEIKDAMAYLRLAVNPHDEVAIRRIANVPTRGVGQGSLRKLLASHDPYAEGGFATTVRRFADEGSRLQGKTRDGLRDLATLLENIAHQAEHATAAEVLETIVTDTDYEAWLEANEENGEERVQNVRELLASAQEFCAANDDGSVLAFVEQAALNAPEPTDDDRSQVQMMTVHAAKGLEFPVVFVTGMEDAQFPLVRRSTETDYDEERRLCYVAYTRAKNHLYVSAATRRRLYGKVRDTEPSTFLLELPDAVTELLPESASRSLDWRAERVLQAPRSQRGGPSYDEFDQRPWQERSARTVPASGMVFGSNVAPKSTPNATGLEGKRARHKTFGDGIVVAAQDVSGKVRLTIDFPGVGRKKIVRRFVELLD